MKVIIAGHSSSSGVFKSFFDESIRQMARSLVKPTIDIIDDTNPATVAQCVGRHLAEVCRNEDKVVIAIPNNMFGTLFAPSIFREIAKLLRLGGRLPEIFIATAESAILQPQLEAIPVEHPAKLERAASLLDERDLLSSVHCPQVGSLNEAYILSDHLSVARWLGAIAKL